MTRILSLAAVQTQELSVEHGHEAIYGIAIDFRRVQRVMVQVETTVKVSALNPPAVSNDNIQVTGTGQVLQDGQDPQRPLWRI